MKQMDRTHRIPSPTSPLRQLYLQKHFVYKKSTLIGARRAKWFASYNINKVTTAPDNHMTF